MLHMVHYPREILVDRVVFTPHDHDLIALCRGAHNRLGFAYQMGFVRLTGRFPAQQPLEILDDLLAFVAHEVALDATLIKEYAQRQATVSAHQEHIRLYLGFRPFGPTEGKLRCNPVDMLIRGQHCRFSLLHWHFCPKMAFYSPLYHQFGRQNYRFLEFTEIHPDTNKLQRFVE